MARSGSKRRNSAASAQGQEASIAVLAIDPHFQGYAKPWFSVYPLRALTHPNGLRPAVKL